MSSKSMAICWATLLMNRALGDEFSSVKKEIDLSMPNYESPAGKSPYEDPVKLRHALGAAVGLPLRRFAAPADIAYGRGNGF